MANSVAKAHGGLPKTPTKPPVDFFREMVIAVFAGEVSRFTRFSIVRISRENRLVVLVRIAEFQPGPVLTDPGTATTTHIVRLPRADLPVVFIRVKTPEKDIY